MVAGPEGFFLPIFRHFFHRLIIHARCSTIDFPATFGGLLITNNFSVKNKNKIAAFSCILNEQIYSELNHACICWDLVYIYMYVEFEPYYHLDIGVC